MDHGDLEEEKEQLKRVYQRGRTNEQLENEKQRKREAAQLQRDFKTVAMTEAGRGVFRWFMQQCGFTAPSVVINASTGEIYTDSTVYNEARRNLYLDVRKLIPTTHLVKIEHNPKNRESKVDVD